MTVNYSQLNNNALKKENYIMQPAKVQSNLYSGFDSKQVSLPTLNPVISTNQKNNKLNLSSKSSKITKLAIGITAAVLSILGICYSVRNSQKLGFSLRNMGKKGIQNFLNSESDETLKSAINVISQNAELKTEIDKMGIRNIKYLAKFFKRNEMQRLALNKASISVSKGITSKGSMPLKIINFSNKKDFGLYKEIMRANSYCNFMNDLNNSMIQLFETQKGMVSKTSISNSTGIKMFPLSRRTEIASKGEGRWAINFAMFGKSSQKGVLYQTNCDTDFLKMLNGNTKDGFLDFMSKCNPEKEQIMLRFNNFGIN